MTKERSLLGRFFLADNPTRDEDGDLRGMLEEPYVRHHCSQEEIYEIRSDPELVHACRERLEVVFGSDELDPRPEQPTQGKG